jgi:UPF0755 protein
LRTIVVAVLAVLLLAAASLWLWARSVGPGTSVRFRFEVSGGASASTLAAALEERGALQSPRLFALYLWWSGGEPAPGVHLLRGDLSARELAQRLLRVPGRPSARLTFPEGFTHLQMAERLEQNEVCTADGFRRAVHDPKLLAELAVRGPSAEGRLFPATYDFFVDSEPEQIVRLLVGETRKRLGKLEAERGALFKALGERLGWDEHEILTLASIVEKEAAGAGELPLVASVFFNRLSDPEFRPLRMLQSDPTAAYGCLTVAASSASCAGFRGQVTPAMLRDAGNPYNTYKNAGLPPGPIGNPGVKAVEAVLEPARTDFLYFFARGGKHTFTRTFAEHRQAIGGPMPATAE